MIQAIFNIVPLLVVALSIVVAGCGGRDAMPEQRVAGNAASARRDRSKIQTPEGRTENSEITAEQDTANMPVHTASTATLDGVRSESKDQTEASESIVQDGRERFALLLPGGPLLIDLWLSIDDRPHTEGIETLVRRVLAAGDIDQDGRPTWGELISNSNFLYGPLGRLTSDTKRQSQQWTKRFDVDGDGRIQPVEVRSWLGRDSQQISQPLTLRSHQSYFYNPREHSRVWRLLDANRDGTLSDDEIDRVSSLLLSLDADDNHIVRLRDLDSVREQVRTAEVNLMRTQQQRGRHAALMLDRDSDWYRVWYLLSDQYATRGDLSESSFPLFPGLFAELDANDNGQLTDTELADLLSREPHLVVKVAFGSSAVAEKTGPSLEVLKTTLNVGSISAASPSHVVLALAGNRVVISVHDMLPIDDIEETAAQRLATLDGDKNGRLDAKEVTTGELARPEKFRALDTDESGTISSAEFTDSLWLEQAVIRSQIRLMVHDQGDSVFRVLDTDADGRLEEREIENAANVLKTLDQNGDWNLSPDEVPQYMTVALIRGEDQNEKSFYIPAIVGHTPKESDVPNWFVRGDSNQDGEISRREVLGNLGHFRQLDVDTDGFIDAAEARLIE